ncbi:fumarylacetoacetate hydrolase family protein [Herbaspirillum lusitanum]|uniref:fumarylacetoacetate hydrolase family protein n=1 Tax=Herbaspirillum lusitanum TaxID=213312 RepID=UPI0002EE7013|nr:fumarylacetoacetate hydrolase family protein [Herbaspirillum lusitanum]
MKIASYLHQGQASYGVVVDAGVIDASSIAKEIGSSLKDVLANGKLIELQRFSEGEKHIVPFSEITFLPVVSDPGKILCVGINYLSHVKETGREIPKYPMFFTRFADSQIGHEQAMIRPFASDKFDFEGELAVVIGKKARHVKAADAVEHVAGYACYNDGSIRDWQKHTIQFIPGKNFPKTGGFGPWLVTADEVGDPSQLQLTTRLNGQVVQEAKTDDLIFSIPALIEYCSTFTELNPGDVIITGTTGGVGAFREPPLWMKEGDVVEVEISRIGILRNTISDEKTAN